ncbi:DUF5691 domain-containing protein [Hymenobacter glaciei]
MISFTEAQALALITDPGTLKRGQELLKPTKWANLGRTDISAWGDCAGSGSKPYLTGIDLTEPAFKCSCPSRVFPCKHGAGLLLLMARQPELFGSNTPPAWLNEWLEKRQQTQEKKAEKPAPKALKAVAVSADAETPGSAPALDGPTESDGTDKSLVAAIPAVDSKRLGRMAAGAEELVSWLEDLLRAGLAALDKQPATFWENQAARLVDNQLPGLASTVRELATLRHAHADWPMRLLGRLGELYLLARAFLNLPRLGADARADVLQQVGVNLKKEDLIATAEPVADSWRVLGQLRWEEERLTARRTWLHGYKTGHTALILEFSFGGQPFSTPFIPHGSYLGELAYYPGLLPLRAAPVNMKFDGTVPGSVVPAGQPISYLLDEYASALARQPWLREWPATLTQVLPTPLPDGRWLLRHATEPLALPLPLRFADENLPWQLLAESGGQPITLFGEWDGDAFRPLSSWNQAEVAAGTPSPTLTVTSTESPGEVKHVDAPSSIGSSKTQGLENEVKPEQLLRVALLGTRQSGESIPAFPARADSPEQQLLLAAGTLALIRKAGHQPARPAGPGLAPAPPELLPVIGPKGTDYLHQMLVNGLHQELLPDYLARLAGRDRLVPPALLVPLLQYAAHSADTRAVLGPVLGYRGHWLAGLHPNWTKLADKIIAHDHAEATAATWETGTLPQRLAWLKEHFGRAANEARALLLAALPTEPAKAQEALLELLGQHLHPDAEPALEALLKARGQEVRRLAAELLVQLPGAALQERLWARVAPLLSNRRGLLGLGKVTLEINLPETWDKSWLADGIEEKNSHFTYLAQPAQQATTVGAGAARLANLLAWVPVDRWLGHLKATPSELLAQALASEWAVPVLSAWAESAAMHCSQPFATAFLQLWLAEGPYLAKTGIRLPLWKLVDLLPAEEQQRLLVPALLQGLREAAGTWETDWEKLEQARVLPGPWPWALVQAAIAVVARHTAGTALALPYLPRERQRFGHFVSQTLLEKLPPANASAARQLLADIPDAHEFYREQFEAFTHKLNFRSDLAASLNE